LLLRPSSAKSQRMPFAIVTGANRGIGLALASLLVERGYAVLGTSRRSAPELAKLGVEVVDGVELTDDAGIAKLVQAVADREVDLLVNNAGILLWQERGAPLDVDGLRRQLEVNAVAPLRVTLALQRSLRRAPRSPSSPAAWARSRTTLRAAPTAIA